MGTKRKLTPLIGEIVEACQPGAFLDAFAGMCSVGSHVASRRPVWSNDLQYFSNLVSKALFCSKVGPPNLELIWNNFADAIARNSDALKREHGIDLARERQAIDALDPFSLRTLFEEKQQQTIFRSFEGRASLSQKDMDR